MFLTFFFSCSREGNLLTVDLFHFLEPLNKCMYVSFIQQCGGVLLIWVTVGPAALPAALGWGLLFKYCFFFYFHLSSLFRSSSFLRKKAQDYNIVDWAVKPELDQTVDVNLMIFLCFFFFFFFFHRTLCYV